jgi:hypothetical protein
MLARAKAAMVTEHLKIVSFPSSTVNLGLENVQHSFLLPAAIRNMLPESSLQLFVSNRNVSLFVHRKDLFIIH